MDLSLSETGLLCFRDRRLLEELFKGTNKNGILFSNCPNNAGPSGFFLIEVV